MFLVKCFHFLPFKRLMNLEKLFNTSNPLCLSLEKEPRSLKQDVFKLLTVISQTVKIVKVM